MALENSVGGDGDYVQEEDGGMKRKLMYIFSYCIACVFILLTCVLIYQILISTMQLFGVANASGFSLAGFLSFKDGNRWVKPSAHYKRTQNPRM
jgi:hypothetical protein